MPKESAQQNTESRPGLLRLLDGSASLVERLYGQSQAARWGLSMERFVLSLERSVTKRFAPESAARQKVEDYLGALHLEDLALACACAAGYESAWEHFFATYKQYLYSAAAAIPSARRAIPTPVNLQTRCTPHFMAVRPPLAASLSLTIFMDAASFPPGCAPFSHNAISTCCGRKNAWRVWRMTRVPKRFFRRNFIRIGNRPTRTARGIFAC